MSPRNGIDERRGPPGSGCESHGVTDQPGAGGLAYRSNGGLARGTDTVPAMLTRGEMVINAKSSQRFFSDLQRINAGMTPQGNRDMLGSLANMGQWRLVK